MLLLPRLWPRPLPSLRRRPVPRVFVSSANSLLLTMGPCDESRRMPVPCGWLETAQAKSKTEAVTQVKSSGPGVSGRIAHHRVGGA